MTAEEWVAAKLHAWQRAVPEREFPWRQFSRPYQVIVTEILLQQTSARSVSVFVEPFLSKYPSWAALDEAREDELERSLSAIGLQRRKSRTLKALASLLRDAAITPNRDVLQRLPGIGPYVASAVLALCFDQPEPMVDTNVVRILSRFFADRERVDYRHDQVLQEHARAILRAGSPRATNFALLDLGAALCTPRRPKCRECPIAAQCKRHGVVKVA